MKWLSMIFRKGEDGDVTETPDAPEVPDVSGEIVRATSAHVRATRSVVQAGVLEADDDRVKRAFEATGRAIRATRER